MFQTKYKPSISNATTMDHNGQDYNQNQRSCGSQHYFQCLILVKSQDYCGVVVQVNCKLNKEHSFEIKFLLLDLVGISPF